MCKYELAETTPARKCQLAGYFKQALKMAQPNDQVLHFPPLPVDDEGFCTGK